MALAVNAFRFHDWYPGVQGSIPTVRHTLDELLTAVGMQRDPLDDLLMCASELSTNCVRHVTHNNPQDPFCVEVRFTRRRCDVVRLSVHDGSRTAPVLPPRAPDDTDVYSVSGRGLPIVAGLCNGNIGCDMTSRGKAIWCELPLNPLT